MLYAVPSAIGKIMTYVCLSVCLSVHLSMTLCSVWLNNTSYSKWLNNSDTNSIDLECLKSFVKFHFIFVQKNDDQMHGLM